MSMHNPFKFSEGYKISLSTVPRLCTANSFVTDSRLFVACSQPPHPDTIRRWMRQGKIITVQLCGKNYINLHATLQKYNLAY